LIIFLLSILGKILSVKCPKCQREIPDTQRFCGDCGTQLPTAEETSVLTKTLKTPKEELTTGSTFARRYQIIEELGKGGMGKVYKANDIEIKEKVALKLIKPEISTDKNTIERFQNELKFARKIRHKNVCQMYDLNRDEGTYYITMEYVEGENLRDMIRMSGQLGIGTAVSIAKQVCEGLAEAHKLGVIHRDLKPSNIMIDREGTVRIMDFGIARSLKDKGITGAGVMIGTPEYMSPEQVEGKEVNRSSDIYSLGAILYEMVTGRVPFAGETALAIALKQKTEEPEDPREFNSHLSEDLSRLIMKCLEKDWDKRYQRAEELRSELENIEKNIPATDRAVPYKKPMTSKEITVTFGAKKLWIPALFIIIVAVVGLFLWHPWSGLESLPAEEKPSIAVLSFEDLSPNKDQEYLCDGFSESLINALNKIQDLRVPGRTSSFSFKGKGQSLQEIGERLNVKSVLEGSVQRAGDELRITVKLVNVSDESVQWSEQYRRKLDDVFAIQDEITSKVVEELKVKLAGGERAELTKRNTTSAEAYQLYLHGRHFRWIETKSNFLKAKGYFEQAIEKDPKYASAYAGLADTYMLLALLAMMPRGEAAYQAKNAAQKALDLDENLSEAHTSVGVIIEIFDWDWEGAEREFKRAIALNPNHFDAHYEYGALLMRLTRLSEAEAELKKAVQIDPLSSRVHSMLGTAYRLKGDKEKAEEYNKKSAELSPIPPETGSAVERAQKLIERDGRLPQRLSVLGGAYLESGQEAEVYKLIDELKRMYEESDIGNTALYLARTYVYLDDKDQALEWLERAYERRDPLLIAINTWTSWDPIRQDPRFKAILTKMGLE
jgi:serine/threonine protein kinase/Tfp pilus assembly protein PilF